MKLTKRSLYMMIILIYIITLFFGIINVFNIAFINYVMRLSIYLMPTLLCLSIIFDNRKNLKCLFKNKISLVLYAINIIWLILTVIFGIRIGFEAAKGFVHFAILLTLLIVLYNVNYTKEDINKIKKHIFISFMITALIGIFQYIFKIGLNTFDNEKYPGINGRINSTFYVATTYDKYVVIMFSIISYELLKNKKSIFYRVLLILSCFAVTFTFSRTGILIYLIMMFVFFAVTLFKKQFLDSLLSVLLVVIMILIPGAKYPIQSALDYAYEGFHIPQRMQVNILNYLGTETKEVEAGECASDDCVEGVEGSKYFRDYYDGVGTLFIKEYPIFGVGVGNETYLYEKQNAKDYLKDSSMISDEYPYMYPHSGYIYLTMEIGYIGIILFIMFILSLIISSLKFKNLSLYVIGMLVFALFMCNLKEGLFHSKQVIYLFVIIYSFYLSILNKQKSNQ